ncbi:SpoIIE family protein phosphatase [Yinghuangia seranimata]|uniref:SpoIIE family protein phosphatase n=1 Tax=Yinghuangia seranimata TaxID=408067 RepID=UPI00248CD7F4|nr:SpoIIE family protein phosphatase [Yinghuangia seranimata]MDI2126600.1 SpoIIE family protein phosphatase [Yinghuangia seranimata]
MLALLLDGTPAGVGVLDRNLRYAYVNPALARMNGVPAAEHIGRTIADVLPGLDAGMDQLRALLADGRPREILTSGQTRAESPYGRRYWSGVYHRIEVNGVVLGVAGVVVEVSEAHRAHAELEQTSRQLAMFDDAAQRIGTTLDMETTCAELADFAVPLLGDLAAVDVFPPDHEAPVHTTPHGVLRLMRAALAATPRLRSVADAVDQPGDMIDFQEGSAIHRCLASGSVVVENFATDEVLERAAPNASRLAFYRAAGAHSGMVVPLSARGHAIGTMTILRAGGSPGFDAQDAVAARELTGRAAVALDSAVHYTHQHAIALELQQALLTEPQVPQLDLEIASRYRPAGSSVLVGGDWFDAIPLSGGRTLQVMGDVMGHGVEAAVAMSHYRSMLRALADTDLAPHDILTRLDPMVSAAGFERAATCLLAILDPAAGEWVFANAGHLPPALVEAGRVRLLDVPAGPPLGTNIGGYSATTVPAPAGPVLLMYTDGLVERRGEDIDASLARLTGLDLPRDTGLEELLDTVLDALAPGAEDDIALLASRQRPDPGTKERP